MRNWFASLTNTNKIAVASVVSVFVVGVAGILFASRGGSGTISLTVINYHPTAESLTPIELQLLKEAITNLQQSQDKQNQQINADHDLEKGDPEQKEKVDKILALLRQDRSADAAPDVNEMQSLKEATTLLLRSQDKQKQQIVADLEEGDFDAAIEKFKALDQEQSQHAQQQVEKAVETKLELAALLTYRDPDESERLLAEATALAPDNLQANREHGVLLLRLGRVDDAIAAFKRIEAWAQAQGDSEWKGIAFDNLGLVYANLGQVEKAIELHQQALVINREIKNRKGEGNTLGNLGSAYFRLGQVEKAIEHFKQALVISREIKDRKGEGNHLNNLGRAYARLGQVEKAIEHYQQALVISREIKDREGEGNDLGNLGNAYADMGHVKMAIDYYQQAFVISREIKDRLSEGNGLNNLGSAYADLGQVEKARDYFSQALKIYVDIKSPNAEVVKSNLAELDQLSADQ